MVSAIWAHRGACDVAPENTLPAFQKAIKMGADGIELDVRRTTDGVLIVCHDESLERTSNGLGKLTDYAFSGLRELDFSAGTKYVKEPWYRTSVQIPTLAEVLEIVQPTDLTLNIELKHPDIPYARLEAQVAELVADFQMGDRVIYSSFNHASMKLMKQINPKASCALLNKTAVKKAWKKAAKMGADAIHPNVKFPKLAGLVKNCHEHGIKVRPWTVNSISGLTTCFKARVDAVITNHVLRAKDIRKLVEARKQTKSKKS